MLNTANVVSRKRINYPPIPDFVNPFSEMTYLVTLTKSKLLTDMTILADMTVPISGDVAFDSRTPLCSLEYA